MAVIYLVDTNVLPRFADRTHPFHPTIRTAVRKLRASGHRLCATPQNFAECREGLSAYFDRYNNIREHQSLDYNYPAEICFGNILLKEAA